MALVSCLARPKPKIPFPGLSLIQNHTETLVTQAAVFIELDFISVSHDQYSKLTKIEKKPTWQIFDHMLGQ